MINNIQDLLIDLKQSYSPHSLNIFFQSGKYTNSEGIAQ